MGVDGRARVPGDMVERRSGLPLAQAVECGLPAEGDDAACDRLGRQRPGERRLQRRADPEDEVGIGQGAHVRRAECIVMGRGAGGNEKLRLPRPLGDGGDEEIERRHAGDNPQVVRPCRHGGPEQSAGGENGSGRFFEFDLHAGGLVEERHVIL